MRDNFKNLPYRPGVGLMVLNTKGEVFLGERLDNPGAWQMPQGGIDDEDGDSLEDTIFRELYEETGISSDRAEIIAMTEDWLKYDLPDHLIPKVWNGAFRGQKQKWVLIQFSGHDAEINLSTHRHQEFGNWQWASIDRALDIIVQFKRHTYEAAIEEFKPVLKERFSA